MPGAGDFSHIPTVDVGELVRCGLSPYEALRTATANAGRFAGSDPPFGIVAPGARADLLLVRGDPLDDVAHLRDPAGVMVRGRWLPRAELDALLEAQPRLHTDEAAFVALLREQGVAAATRAWREAIAEDPRARLFRESTLNGIGYEFLEQHRAQDALAAFELNAAAYPGSADVHDSLGEARRRAGDTSGAIASYERALAMNPWNANTLEWTAPSPPPHLNWGPTLPTVHRGPYEYSDPAAREDYLPQTHPPLARAGGRSH